MALSQEAWDRLHRLTPKPITPLEKAEHAIAEAFVHYRHLIACLFHSPHPHEVDRWHDDGGPHHPTK